jgi:hypothetical protein
LNLPIEEKITTIARDIYGADGIELSDLAKQQIETYTRQGYGNLPSSCPRPVDLRYVYVWFATDKSRSLHGKNAVFILARSQIEKRSDWWVLT